MRFFHFSEQPYPEAWDKDPVSLRVTLPSSHCDPEVASRHYNRYLDEWAVADELGFDIMVNEHHSTPTCLSVSATLTLAILARQTKKARLLALGIPIANRPDPIRVAEEIAMVDLISNGRLEVGLVKGVPYEIVPADSSAIRMMDRFWEAHDLIEKALTSHDGPFSWEGQFFTYRNVNVWPRPLQQPAPPIWFTATSPGSVRSVAEKGYVLATFLVGREKARQLFDLYREVYVAQGRPQPELNRFAYLAMMAVADNHDEAMRRAELVAGYVRSGQIVAPTFSNPPGYVDYRAVAQGLRAKAQGKAAGGPHGKLYTKSGKQISLTTASVEDMVDAGLMFAGTPDEVFDQLVEFDDAVGGIGNYLLMGQGGFLSHKDTVDSLTLFSREVMPRMRERRALAA